MAGLDYRLLLLGAILPDLIDKPLGLWLLRDTLSNGRVFFHTLLFLALLTLAGMWRHNSARNAGLLVIALGVASHLVLDEMWREPRTLLWPVFGFVFDKVSLSRWFEGLLKALVSDPFVYIPETAGLLVLAAFAFSLFRRRCVRRFLRTGMAPRPWS